jgi:hypothetical protein
MLLFGYSFAFDISASVIPPSKASNLMSSTPTPLHTSKISPKSPLTRVKRGGYIPSTSSLILPSCASSRVLKVAFQAGFVCLSSQLVLQSAFKRSKDPLLNTNPGYLAHTCVALPLMAFVSGVGSVGWWLKGRPETAVGRIMKGSDEARLLGAILCGIMTFWDVPTSFLVPGLRSPDILIHHAILAVVSFIVATTLPSYYCFFYFGVVELISPPLAIYDQLEKTCEIASTKSDPRLPLLRVIRDRFQILSGLIFTITRAYLFTKVTFINFLPDIISVMRNPNAKSLMFTLRVSAVAAVGFSVLQLVWFEKMIAVVTGRRKDDRVKSK